MKSPYPVIDKWSADFYWIKFKYNFGGILHYLFYMLRLILNTIENLVSIFTLGIIRLNIYYPLVYWYGDKYEHGDVLTLG